MEHYITEIQINKVRHLTDYLIELNKDSREHLLLTGKNGSGKTSLILEMRDSLDNCLERQKDRCKIYAEKVEELPAVKIAISNNEDLVKSHNKGEFITAYFPADRQSEITPADGVEDIKLKKTYSFSDEPAKLLLKYMVHLKTQQAYAKNENDMETEQLIAAWFQRFENALRVLLDEDTVQLKYDYKRYDFKIEIQGREPFGFHELSDGYSALIRIVADLMLRMDKNWILDGKLSEYNTEGIVLIDELETHLHAELQRKILPFLTEFFPRIQFIVSTHSAYILNSIENACICDLEKKVQFNDFSI